MSTQAEKARRFAGLHTPGKPVILYNAWDAGSAKAVATAGAKAIATGSWSVAAAHGYEDGQAIPLDFVEQIVRRIAVSVALPVTVDFEGGYGETASSVAANAVRIIEAGAIGINFEDRIVGGEPGVHEISLQQARIRAIREAADSLQAPLFINARTDLFLQAQATQHDGLLDQALQRAHAYHAAGASGFFAPALVDEALIARLCAQSPMPVNIMIRSGAPSHAALAQAGVARISYGPIPYVETMAELGNRAGVVLRS